MSNDLAVAAIGAIAAVLAAFITAVGVIVAKRVARSRDDMRTEVRKVYHEVVPNEGTSSFDSMMRLVNSVRSDVQAVRGDVGDVRDDNREIRQEIRQIRDDTKAAIRDHVDAYHRIEGDQ